MKLILLLLFALPVFSQPITIDCGSSTDQFFIGGSNDFKISYPGATGDLTVRFGAFKYSIPRPPGFYNVTLFFRETGTVTATGGRKFTVKINDQLTELVNFDLFAQAGLAEFTRSYVAISYGTINLDFTYQIRSAVISKIVVEPWLTAGPPGPQGSTGPAGPPGPQGVAGLQGPSGSSISYVVPMDPKAVRVTGAVPTWFPGQGYAVPRPDSVPDATIQLLYVDVAVYKKGVRMSGTNQMAGLADYSLTKWVAQLNIMPANSQRWPADEPILVDYTAIYPAQVVPQAKIYSHPTGLRRVDVGGVSITGALSSVESLVDTRWSLSPTQ